MQRINWIDWAKAWCMTIVVFEHIPHDNSPFLLQYLTATNLSTFFFISGYLKKPVISEKEAIKKYAYCILVPYLIYNIIFYPYWICKTYIKQGQMPSFLDCLKPICGTLLGQLDSAFSCQLNGVTWFLISLFFSHLITDMCNQTKKNKIWMCLISLVTMFLYGLNKSTHYAPNLSFHGLIRCITFFFMGNLLRQSNYFKEVCVRKDFIWGITTLSISIVLFYWHITEKNIISHIILYFIVNTFSVVGIISLWRCTDAFKSKIITYISIGTMVIFGFHGILIGIINYGTELLFHTQSISFKWNECAILTLLIELIMLPIIIILKKYYPIFLGKKRNRIFV